MRGGCIKIMWVKVGDLKTASVKENLPPPRSIHNECSLTACVASEI